MLNLVYETNIETKVYSSFDLKFETNYGPDSYLKMTKIKADFQLRTKIELVL